MPSGLCNRTNINIQRIKYPHYLQSLQQKEQVFFSSEHNSGGPSEVRVHCGGACLTAEVGTGCCWGGEDLLLTTVWQTVEDWQYYYFGFRYHKINKSWSQGNIVCYLVMTKSISRDQNPK